MLVRALNQSALNSPLRLTNVRVLEDAKGALLMHVSNNALDSSENYPGRLPCPEDTAKIGTASEGDALAYCVLPAVGRLPWKSLGYTQAPVDADGEPLWYAVSPGFNRSSLSVTLQINSDTPAGLTVDGSTARAVALIFAPGRALSGQSRSTPTPSSPPAVADYLELENASPSTPDIKFATYGPTSSTVPIFNDQVAIVTHRDLFSVVEPAVAKRIGTDVVPALNGVYDSADWNASATSPLYPFAATFGNPDTSNYTGAAATYQGLLPLSYSKQPGSSTDCVVSSSDSRCNPSLVTWQTGSGLSYAAPLPIQDNARWSVYGTYQTMSVPASNPYISVTEVANSNTTRGTLAALDCSASTTTQISCDITYGRSCGSYPSNCSSSTVRPRVRLTVRAQNVAKALKAFDSSAITASEFKTTTSYGESPLGTLRSDGDADITTEWRLPSVSCRKSSCSTYTITIPIGLIADHFLANSADNVTGWFLNNNWHKLTYYAISSGYAPGSSASCVTSGSPACLTFNAATGNTNPRAILILAGHAIRAQTRPSSALTDYLEAENLSPMDTTFVRQNLSADFNDRVIVVY